jgi:phage gpG-like protein
MANDLTLKIERRIIDRLRAYDQDDPRMKAALLRIGFLLEAQIKLNIRKQKLIDTGRLINSIRSEVTKDGLTVGAYNMPYAAIHEFGGTISAKNARYLTIPMSPEFKGRRASEFGDLFVKRIRNRAYLVRRLDSGQLQFCYMLREQVTMPARPFMRPALQQHKDRIIEIIRDLIK